MEANSHGGSPLPSAASDRILSAIPPPIPLGDLARNAEYTIRFAPEEARVLYQGLDVDRDSARSVEDDRMQPDHRRSDPRIPASVPGVVTPDERFTLHVAARLSGVHVATVWRWVLRGVRGRKLRSIMIGGRRYILARDLEAFLAQSDSASVPSSQEVERCSEAEVELDRLGI